MKKICLIFLLMLPFVLNAQQNGYVKSTETEKKNNREFNVHKVLKGQTLYAISKLYEVDLDSIIYFNPEIKDGLKTGISVLIPIPVKTTAKLKSSSMEEKKAVEEKKITEEKKLVKEKTDSLPSEKEHISCIQSFHGGPFEVGIMLPLYLSEMDSIPTDDVDEKLTGLDLKSLRFIQFYEGVLMAVDSLVNMGLSVNLHVYDVDEDTTKIKKILRDPEVKKMDLIIGLLYGASFQKLAVFAKNNKIPVINPLSNKLQHIENNPFVFLANPTVPTMAGQIAEFLAAKYFDNVIILLNSGKENEKRSMKIIYDELIDEFKQIGKPTNNIYMFSGEGEINKIPPILSGTTKNAIVILSNDELFVANVIRYIKEWSATHPVMVFGMPGWLDFKSVESKLLVELSFHSFGTSYVDYHDANTIHFIHKYRDQYKAEPVELAFQGFDVGYYFLSCLMKYGKNFMNCTPEFNHQGMQTRFIYKQNGNNGYENTWLNIFRIQDYQVINARD